MTTTLSSPSRPQRVEPSARGAAPAASAGPRSARTLLLAAPAILLLLVLFVGALATLLEYTFQHASGTSTALTPAAWIDFFTSSYRWSVVGKTAVIGVEATVATVIVGFPTAYALHRIRSRGWRYAGLFIVFAPLLTSVVARTYGWSLLLGDSGMVNWMLQLVHLPPLHLLYATPSVLIALVHILLPFMVFPVMTSLGQIDGALGEAARDLGAPPWVRLRNVTLPLAAPGILGGAQLVFAMTISSFATPALLGGGKVSVLATLVYSDVNNVQWPMASVTSYVLLGLALVVLGVFGLLQRAVSSPGGTGVTASEDVKGLGVGSIVWLALVDVFVLAPLAIIVVSSFSSVSYGAWPIPGWSTKWYANLAVQEGLGSSVVSSLVIAVVTTVIVVVLGTAAAVAYWRTGGRGVRLLQTFTLSPTVVPKVAIGFAGFILIQRLGFLQGIVGIVLMHCVVTLPFVMVVVGAALSRVDTTLEEAAHDLGAGAFRAFATTTLPAIRSAVIAAALFAFIISFDEVDMTVFLLSPGESTLPVWMFTYMQKYQDPTLAALSTLLIAFSLLIAVIAGAFLFRTAALPNDPERTNS
ncbi:MAG TPA: ABC transporter permease subunit [Gryllotalpicola sp.]